MIVKKGLRVYPTIVVTPSRIPLGLLSAKMWTNEAKERINQRRPQNRPLEQKESYRWLESFHESKKVAKKFPIKIGS